VITGEAGVGKSRLATALEGRARALGFIVLHGESIEFGGEGFAYAPVASALRDMPLDWTEHALRTATPEVREALAALLPNAGGTDTGQLAAGSAHGRRCVILTDLLGRLAQEQTPVVIVLEDVHWADRSSRDYIAYLSRNLRRQRIACAITFRTGELAAEHPWRRLLAELTRRPWVTTLDIPPLTAVEVGRQLEAIAGEPVDQGVRDELHARAGGNPFLVEELFAARAGGEPDAIPATLADAALVRVQRLDAGTRRILAIVAVAGGRVDHRVLTRVASPADPLPALRGGLDAGLLVRDRDDRGVAFRHGLMGEVLYGHLLPDERADLHRAIARALSATGDAPASQLAHHWHRAGEHADALAASVTAGLEAARMFAFAEAQAHLERALDLWESVDPAPGTLPLDHVELLSRAAQAARFSGDRERAITLGRRALNELDASVDPARAARLFERLGEAHFWDDETALGWYGKALALLPAGPSPERARLLAAEGHALMGLRRWADARARCEQALDIGRAIDRHEADAGALTTLGLVLAFLGEPVEGEAHLRSALERAQRSGSADDVARAYINLGELLRLRGDHAGALQVMIEGEAFATGAGMRGSFGQFMFVNGADDLLRLGRWDDVRERLGRSERISLGLTSEAMHRAIAAQLYALRGDVAAARRDLDRGIAIVDGLPSEFVTPIRTAGAVLALVERDPADARLHVDAGLADLAAMDPLYTPPLLTAGIRAEADLADLARARRHPADADEALWRARRLAADTDRIVAARPGTPPDALAHQALAHAEAARATGQHAVEGWAEAAGRFLDLAEPYPAAYAQLRQAEALLAASGERREAARLLASTDRTARALGAEPLLADIAGLARRARLKLVAHAEELADVDGGRAGLTRREEDVLRLLAEGLTNREIGRRLFITQKTVGTHVAHIFQKLDVHTRLEAAGRAQQLGVLKRSH
jgi:DNA-binding CsgD family transcriptional regulator